MKNQIIISLILCLTTGLSAQKNEPITVKAGTSVKDYFSFQEMYRYPEFINGRVFFKNGNETAARLNYNLLFGEMQYIQSKDTLSIANEKDIICIAISGDTFFFNKGYLELVYSGQVKVAIKQYFQLKQIQKKDSYGSAGSTSATDSYSKLQTGGQTYKLIVNQDRIFQNVSEFYLATSSSDFVPFTKKKVMQLFPQYKKSIQEYLKPNKIKFDSRDDLLRFAVYLNDLQ